MQKCPQCEKENPDEAIQCYGCGTEFDDDSIPVVKLTKAGFWIRGLARTIDSFFCAGLAIVSFYLSGIVLYLMGNFFHSWHHLPRISLIAFILCALASLAYNSFCEGVHGATLGKKICGIRVVSQDGTPSNLTSAAIRTIIYCWDGLVFGAAGYYGSMEKSPLNQRHGDVWAKTAVLKDSEVSPEHRRTDSDYTVGLILGIVSYLGLYVSGLVLSAIYQM